eukprot:2522310-Rhodomonas_salina.2
MAYAETNASTDIRVSSYLRSYCDVTLEMRDVIYLAFAAQCPSLKRQSRCCKRGHTRRQELGTVPRPLCTSPTTPLYYLPTRALGHVQYYAMSLCARHGVPGTEIRYGATSVRCDAQYKDRLWYYQPSSLHGVCGTELAYAATGVWYTHHFAICEVGY